MQRHPSAPAGPRDSQCQSAHTLLVRLVLLISALSCSDATDNGRDPWPRESGAAIAFMSDRNGNRDIFVMRPDGSDVRAITSDPYADEWPSWSPDGDSIAFVSTRDSVPGQARGGTLYLMAADGTGLRRLTTPGQDYRGPIAWVPDGRRLAVVCHNDVAQLCVIDRDGGNLRMIDSAACCDYEPSWSPDGLAVVFSTNRRGPRDLYIIDSAGGTPRRIAGERANQNNLEPAWSPTGARIVFRSDTVEAISHLYLINPDGGSIRRITDATHDDAMPAWAPDGHTLAFVRQVTSQQWDIVVMDTAGGPALNVTQHPAFDASPAWRPAPRP